MADADPFWDDLLAYINDRVLTPVVGPELLIAEGDGGRTLYERVAEQLAARYHIPAPTGARALAETVAAVLRVSGAQESQRLYRIVSELIAGQRLHDPDTLRDLARISDLRLFVSMSPDRFLTQALNDIRFQGQPRTRDAWFSPNQSTVEQQRSARPPTDEETVVFRLFGQASSTPQYAIHDEDYLEWLHALLSESARLPEWLTYRLKDQPLLFVGCDVPDWLGRFIVRLSSNARLSMATKQIYFVDSGRGLPPSLLEFFSTYCGRGCVHLIKDDPRSFITELHRRWAATRSVPAADLAAGHLAARDTPGTIFISYVREDVESARRLAGAIAALGGDVWMDERTLLPGEAWEQAILSGIRRGVRLFVPAISANTEARDEGYVFREWSEAVERARAIPRRRFIVPVVLDRDYDGDPTRYQQIPEAFRQFHFGRAPGGEPDGELLAALTTEIRAMRRVDVA